MSARHTKENATTTNLSTEKTSLLSLFARTPQLKVIVLRIGEIEFT